MKFLTYILTLIEDSVKDRVSHPFFRYFMLSWLIFHWRSIFLFIFASETDLKKLGIESKFIHIYNQFDLHKTPYFGLNGNNINIFLHDLLGPFLLACFFIWVLPKFTLKARKKHNDSFVEEFAEEQRRERKIKEEKIQNYRLDTTELEEKRKKEEEYKKTYELWREEYEDFKNNTKLFEQYNYFSDIINRIHQDKGNMMFYFTGNQTVDDPVPQNILTFFQTKEILEQDEGKKSLFHLTEKGNKFAEFYIGDGKLRDFKRKPPVQDVPF